MQIREIRGFQSLPFLRFLLSELPSVPSVVQLFLLAAFPLRSKRGGVYYISATDISAILFEKNRKLFLRELMMQQRET